MSKTKVFPEVRGSHLASQLERERVLKIKKRRKQRKGKRIMDNVTKLEPRAKKSRRNGKEIPSRDRDTIVAAVGRFGREKIIHLLWSLDPNNPSPMSTISDLVRESDHRWRSRNYESLTELAKYIRTNCQDGIRFPERGTVALPKEESTPLDSTLSPELRLFMQQQMEQSKMIVSAMQALSSSFAGVRQAEKQPAQLPPRSSIERDTERGTGDAARPRDFSEHPTWLKRKILVDIHSRVGDRIKRESGGQATRPYATAWNRSYEAFHSETGIDIKARATKTSERSGAQVRPVEIIEQINELDRFYDAVSNIWDGWF